MRPRSNARLLEKEHHGNYRGSLAFVMRMRRVVRLRSTGGSDTQPLIRTNPVRLSYAIPGRFISPTPDTESTARGRFWAT